MKILIISDTHGSHKNFDRVIEKERPLDMLIHLGDVEGDEDYIPAVADCPVHMVRGNNDFFSGLPGEEEFMIGGYHIFITHGHGYYVSMGEERLKQEARGRGADIAMYGHTHRPFYEKEMVEFPYSNCLFWIDLPFLFAFEKRNRDRKSVV